MSKYFCNEKAYFNYKCNKCRKIVKRIEKRRWIKSYCEEKGMWSRLYFIPFARNERG